MYAVFVLGAIRFIAIFILRVTVRLCVYLMKMVSIPRNMQENNESPAKVIF